MFFMTYQSIDIIYENIYFKDIINSIQLYFGFLDDLINLGLVSLGSLSNLNDFYLGKQRVFLFQIHH